MNIAIGYLIKLKQATRLYEYDRHKKFIIDTNTREIGYLLPSDICVVIDILSRGKYLLLLHQGGLGVVFNTQLGMIDVIQK